MTVVDLFAGPGGWDIGARELGIDPIGLEQDRHAIATRQRNGLATIAADLSTYGPERLDGTYRGIIASPPCPLFSTAGNREGVDWLPHLCEVAATLTITGDRPPLHELAMALDPAAPPEAALSLVPLVWILHRWPEWIALEQVPAVLPLWEAIADRLMAEQYEGVWPGIVNAADYGVPQARRRAVLLANGIDGSVGPPRATHSSDGVDLPRWVSMGEALVSAGLWDDPAVAHLNTGRAWVKGGTRDDAQTIAPDKPAPTITGKSAGQFRWSNGQPFTVDQAAALQSFPPGHEFIAGPVVEGQTSMFAELEPMGSLPERSQQIGNAVPPRLAWHLLRAVTS